MQVVLLAGGRGTRISEETVDRPKPMIEIGSRPILWHIMQIYASFGHKDFFIACGYKGEVIKEYFHLSRYRYSDFVVDLGAGESSIIKSTSPDWRVTLIDTGLHTQTGGRLLRLRNWLNGTTFMVTYGDGVADIDIRALLAFHRAHGRLATVTAVHPPARFGALVLEGTRVTEFAEKKHSGENWINGGFFVFEPEIFDYLVCDSTSLENGPLAQLASDGQLMAFEHQGFWQPVDTLRDKQVLDTLWSSGRAPWRTWV